MCEESREALKGAGVLVTLVLGLTTPGLTSVMLVAGTGLWGLDELESLARYLHKHCGGRNENVVGTGVTRDRHGF